MKSLLDWDDADDQPVTAANPDLVARALDAVRNIDPAPGLAEFEQHAMMVKKHDNPSNNPIIAKAIKAIQGDGDLSGDRVNVGDKFLINCQADLNQLVPFKYTWAWAMYLDSTEKHWMPGEVDLRNDYSRLKQLRASNDPVDQKLLKTFNLLLAEHDLGGRVAPSELTLGLYRLNTNPECRQYILRLAFEERAFTHAVQHVAEALNLDGDYFEPIKELHLLLRKKSERYKGQLYFFRDSENSTTEKDHDVANFLTNVAILLGSFRYLFHLVPMYYILKHSNDRNAGVAKILTNILADFKRQASFGTRLYNGVAEENPDCYSPAMQEILVSIIEHHTVLTVDIARALWGEDDEFTYTAHRLKTIMLTDIGCKPDLSVENDNRFNWYIDLAYSSGGDYDHGGTTIVNDSTGSLSWD